MVAARYTPLERAGELIAPTKVAPEIVTGSVAVAVPWPASRAPVQDTFGVRMRAQVNIILGGAQEVPGNEFGARRQQSPGGQTRGTRRRNDGNWSDEIYIGGTGLLADGASERLPHPLAAANPDSFVVVCEAGCRPGRDQIVYKVSKTSASAAARAKRRMDVTAGPVAVASADNAAVCIAGCYDNAPAPRSHVRSGSVPLQTGGASKTAGAAQHIVLAKAARSEDEERLRAQIYQLIAAETRRPVPVLFGRLPGAAVAVATASLDLPRDDDAVRTAAVQTASLPVRSTEALGARHLISQETHVHAVRKRVEGLAALSRRLNETVYALRRDPVTPLNHRSHDRKWLAIVARYADESRAGVLFVAQLDRP